MIVDEKDSMPDAWLVDEPELVNDPMAVMPEEWNEEEDGEFAAPKVANPKCTVGCGQWKPRSIPNPKYRGKWVIDCFVWFMDRLRQESIIQSTRANGCRR